MKSLFLTLSTVLAFTLGVYAQETPATSKAEIEFEEETHDFGNLKQYDDQGATTEFKFTNTGTEPLIISNAKGSCGCTVPEWPREPIGPGKTASIRVKYDSKRVGPINKSVTITSNASNAPTKVIRIKGNIEAAPATDDAAMPVKQPSAAPSAQ